MLPRDDSDPRTPESRPGLRIPWGVLTVSLAIFAIVSLGTLSVVASVQNADTLSTVALALAVLAFAAQLVVSLAQANSGAQQIAQSERINADTQATLAELRATSTSLLSNQKELFGQVLRAALPEVARELSTDSESEGTTTSHLDAAEIESRLEAAVAKALRGISSPIKVLADVPSPLGQTLNLPLDEIQSQWAVRTLHQLGAEASKELYRIINYLKREASHNRAKRTPEVNLFTRVGQPPASWDSLEASGIATFTFGSIMRDDRVVARVLLQDKGLELARFLAPYSAFPDWIFNIRVADGVDRGSHNGPPDGRPS
jgi:hypothetical protein